MPRLGRGSFLLRWLQTKLPLTPQPARKLTDTKGFQNVLLSPYKPANKWYRNEVRKESPPTRALDSFTYLKVFKGKDRTKELGPTEASGLRDSSFFKDLSDY